MSPDPRPSVASARLSSLFRPWLLLAGLALACSDPADGEDECSLDDADGIIGGSYTFEVTVDDAAFAPLVLKAQNDSAVTLRLTNTGSTPHDLTFDCLPTPNDNGCPLESCFPDEANVPVVLPGESASVTFDTPLPEGIYDFRSSQDGDTQTGQFIVQ